MTSPRPSARPPARTRPVHVPPGGPGQTERPSPAIFAAMGEEGVFGLLDDFYGELGRSSIEHLFPEGTAALKAASERSAAFFVQLLGGPPLFNERYGPPRMRMRHLPFEIDDAARAEWLRCFDLALERSGERHGFPDEHLPGFRSFLESFSAWMVNVAPPE